MVISTKYKANAKGVGTITAKGGGKQRTSRYDHSLSPEQNHGAAAGHLLRDAHGWTVEVLDDHIENPVEFGPGTARFTLTYNGHARFDSGE